MVVYGDFHSIHRLAEPLTRLFGHSRLGEKSSSAMDSFRDLLSYPRLVRPPSTVLLQCNMVFKLTLSLLTLATLSILGASSPLQSGLPLGLLKRQETTSGSSDTSTTLSSTASSTSLSAAAPTATPSGSNVDQATAQIIAGLRAASDGVREVHGVAATTNNSAVLALSNIASVRAPSDRF